MSKYQRVNQAWRVRVLSVDRSAMESHMAGPISVKLSEIEEGVNVLCRGCLHLPRLSPHGRYDGGYTPQGGGGGAGNGSEGPGGGSEGGHVAVDAHHVDPVGCVHDCLYARAKDSGNVGFHELVTDLNTVAWGQEGIEAINELRVALEQAANSGDHPHPINGLALELRHDVTEIVVQLGLVARCVLDLVQVRKAVLDLLPQELVVAARAPSVSHIGLCHLLVHDLAKITHGNRIQDNTFVLYL